MARTTQRDACLCDFRYDGPAASKSTINKQRFGMLPMGSRQNPNKASLDKIESKESTRTLGAQGGKFQGIQANTVIESGLQKIPGR